ncbi:biotin--acetyl-CoA-carboxylase ligase [Mycolicibacillus trivialis]|uniref:biotin--[biotin carboxyl-carrier protein] ligase n=2 Tax=Mycolicibacillus trivialis TaxID=1798 RepID=A0A1X2EKU2_9MYCO|nr:biotin--[acetyl-CoA-carboxylase] ligase [Mycolicibacillus trivialis]ORX05570.1 biotin--acetyl-CoA-carboxylase ligase [Mycolicibacillus trivialis]
MTTDPDTARPPLDAAALRARLAPPWRELEVVDETGSTNADLLARAGSGTDVDGLVLLAEHQTAGRGRHGRHWSAPPRSQLSLSVGVRADGVPSAAWGWLPLATGVAVADALAGLDETRTGLKWPNDVLAGDPPGKLAGILAEVAAPAAVIVVGLGLNVTMTAEEAPDPAATSLSLLGAATDRTALAAAVLHALGARIDAWRRAGGADAALIDDYRRHSVTLGRRVRAIMPGDRTLAGTATGVDDLGRLTVDTGGQTVAVSAGDITHLRGI